ncbi:MAG: 5-(carboxyamino)imidazole ribonucleotide synthase [Oleiphilus sp.]
MMTKVGVLGAGQLGRMLALAGYPLELDFHFYDTSGQPSVGLGDLTCDPDADLNNTQLSEFLADVDVVTYEFEHLPLSLTQHIEEKATLYPPSRSIEVCQNRALEKALFTKLGIPTPEYHIVNSLDSLKQAVDHLGCPVVTKTTTEGYDGKGQFVIKSAEQCDQAWQSIGITDNGPRELIVESFVNFKRELSIIAVRSVNDEMLVYPLTENDHHEGILRYSFAPAEDVNEETEAQANSYIKELMHELGHVGILTLELFETEDGLVANEMAPRVHNSGHWTIEGSVCSQFENHLRAITGMPLGSTEAILPTCMINIISEKGDIPGIMALPYAHIHLYGKEERQGRKLGHITVQADTFEELKWRVKNIATFLPGSPDLN